MMAEQTKIDALITLLVWDAYEAISHLIDSLSRGVSGKARWKLLILDQASKSETADMLMRFADRQKNNVILDRVPENIGYPSGHNRLHRLGRSRFDSRYLVTINSDIVFHDVDWLDILVDFMDANTKVGLAGPAGIIYQREPEDRLGWCRMATPGELFAGHFDAVSGSVCIVRQSMIESIGLFDEIFTPGYYEDTDFSFRARSAGWELAICSLRYDHQGLGEKKSTSYIKRAELSAKYGNFQKRNRNIFVERWLSGAVDVFDAAEIAERFPLVYLPSARAVPC